MYNKIYHREINMQQYLDNLADPTIASPPFNSEVLLDREEKRIKRDLVRLNYNLLPRQHYIKEYFKRNSKTPNKSGRESDITPSTNRDNESSNQSNVLTKRIFSDKKRANYSKYFTSKESDQPKKSPQTVKTEKARLSLEAEASAQRKTPGSEDQTDKQQINVIGVAKSPKAKVKGDPNSVKVLYGKVLELTKAKKQMAASFVKERVLFNSMPSS